MPRVKFTTPPEQLEIEDDLRKRYGGMMTAAAVGRELGLTIHQYTIWLRDVNFVMVNGRKRYRVAAVAEKLYRSDSRFFPDLNLKDA